ncbi:MAG: MIP family channel protein [Bacilli bacterium]|nr:MIP family channel protein [Bacilli bacterium]
MKKYVAEFIGTLVLVVFGCGSAVGINSLLTSSGATIPLAISTLTIAIAFGLVIVAMAYSIGRVSGCHINPAVSLGVWMNNKMTTKDFVGYVIAQVIGGLAGAGILAYLFNSTKSLGANGYGELSALGCSMGVAIVIEVILTFVFVLTVLSVTEKAENSRIAGLVIGFTLTLVHILGIPFTGTSVNPARSLGPALISGGEVLSQVWVFILAPLVGAAIAAIVYKLLIDENKTPRKKASSK